EEGVTMVAGDGGSIFLVGDRVRNQGTLRANGGGSVGVVAAGTVEMEVGDSGFIRLVSYEALPAEGQGSNLSVRRVALNAGNIEATDGTVVIAQANLYNRNNGGDLAPTPLVLEAGYGSEQSPNGAYNTGTILARGVNGQGSVTVDARGENNVAVNAGTIDVSADNGTAQAGSILMTGHKVLGGHGDGDGVGAVARRLANGPSGGGNITRDARNATDSEASALVHTNSASLIEANATAAGNGGNVVLSTDIIGDGPVTWRNPSGRVESLGQIRAVGAGGGRGGTLTIAAPEVFIAEREGVAGSTLGAGGLWRLISSNILIGGGSGGGEYFGGYVSASEISRLLNEGTSVRIEARHGDWEGSVFNDGFMYVYGDAAINRNIGTDAVDLTLASTNDLQVAGGASIAASGESRLNVTLHADVDKSEAEPD